MGRIDSYEQAEVLDGSEFFVAETKYGTRKVPYSLIEKCYREEMNAEVRSVFDENAKNHQNTVIAHSDEEFEEILTQLTENLSALSPMLVIAGYDAKESMDLNMGEGFMFIDSGDGNIDNALMLTHMPCETPFTGEDRSVLEICKKFADGYEGITSWKKLSDNSKSSVTYSLYADATSLLEKKTRYIKADVVCTGEQITLALNTKSVKIFRSEVAELFAENEDITVHIEIEPGEGFWLVSFAFTGSNASKTMIKEITENSDYISSLAISTGSSNAVSVSNAYGKG